MRGYPDFGVTEEFGKTLLPADIAELAVRLGSIVTFDRRGDVFDLDDFEGLVFHWEKVGSAVLPAYLDSTISKFGSQSVRLDTAVAPGSKSEIYKYLSFPKSKKLGIEFSFSQQHANVLISLGIYYYDSALVKRVWIQLATATGLCRLRDSEWNWQDIVTIGTLYLLPTTFHTFKVVADFEKGYYARFIIDNSINDISTHALSMDTEITSPYIQVFFHFEDTTAGIKVCYADNYVLTRNEP